jgi:hypothetical protein
VTSGQIIDEKVCATNAFLWEKLSAIFFMFETQTFSEKEVHNEGVTSI